jgi:hypothetical protein
MQKFIQTNNINFQVLASDSSGRAYYFVLDIKHEVVAKFQIDVTNYVQNLQSRSERKMTPEVKFADKLTVTEKDALQAHYTSEYIVENALSSLHELIERKDMYDSRKGYDFLQELEKEERIVATFFSNLEELYDLREGDDYSIRILADTYDHTAYRKQDNVKELVNV